MVCCTATCGSLCSALGAVLGRHDKTLAWPAVTRHLDSNGTPQIVKLTGPARTGMAFAPPRAADPPGEVLGRSYSAKAVQVVASVSPPDRDHSGPRFPEIIVCGNGSGSSSLLDRLLHRRLLSVGAPRTSKRPVRCRVADRRLVAPRAGTSDGSETLRINELTNARAGRLAGCTACALMSCNRGRWRVRSKLDTRLCFQLGISRPAAWKG